MSFLLKLLTFCFLTVWIWTSLYLHGSLQTATTPTPSQQGSSKTHLNPSMHPSPKATAFVKEVRIDYETIDTVHCPFEPDPTYPQEYPVLDVTLNWPPDDITRPKKIHRGLCIFDWEKDMEQAMNYRRAEKPFIVRGNPDLDATVLRWSDLSYLDTFLDQKSYLTGERSERFLRKTRLRGYEVTSYY